MKHSSHFILAAAQDSVQSLQFHTQHMFPNCFAGNTQSGSEELLQATKKADRKK